MSKRFTLQEAQALLPALSELLTQVVSLKAELDSAEAAIQQATERIVITGGMVVDLDAARALRTKRESATAGLREAVERIQETGCILKDLDTGLVDFPTAFRGAEVYLCWKLGEPAIEYWHGQDEGFAGRQSIDQDFRDHHRGDATQ